MLFYFRIAIKQLKPNNTAYLNRSRISLSLSFCRCSKFSSHVSQSGFNPSPRGIVNERWLSRRRRRRNCNGRVCKLSARSLVTRSFVVELAKRITRGPGRAESDRTLKSLAALADLLSRPPTLVSARLFGNCRADRFAKSRAFIRNVATSAAST